jgi:preprotein translocase subunit Sss1
MDILEAVRSAAMEEFKKYQLYSGLGISLIGIGFGLSTWKLQKSIDVLTE